METLHQKRSPASHTLWKKILKCERANPASSTFSPPAMQSHNQIREESPSCNERWVHTCSGWSSLADELRITAGLRSSMSKKHSERCKKKQTLPASARSAKVGGSSVHFFSRLPVVLDYFSNSPLKSHWENWKRRGGSLCTWRRRLCYAARTVILTEMVVHYNLRFVILWIRRTELANPIWGLGDFLEETALISFLGNARTTGSQGGDMALSETPPPHCPFEINLLWARICGNMAAGDSLGDFLLFLPFSQFNETHALPFPGPQYKCLKM